MMGRGRRRAQVISPGLPALFGTLHRTHKISERSLITWARKSSGSGDGGSVGVPSDLPGEYRARFGGVHAYTSGVPSIACKSLAVSLSLLPSVS